MSRQYITMVFFKYGLGFLSSSLLRAFDLDLIVPQISIIISALIACIDSRL